MAEVAPVSVNLAPQLVEHLSSNQDALLAICGMAYITSALLETGNLPDFKQSVTMRLADFYDRVNRLKEPDFRNAEEVERAIEASRRWTLVGWLGWEELGITRNLSTQSTKVTISRQDQPSSFNFYIGQMGE